jgi:anthranilate synthase / indole-3-glycerol phosphate synthase / phosphoribosylanthranilate isomerase
LLISSRSTLALQVRDLVQAGGAACSHVGNNSGSDALTRGLSDTADDSLAGKICGVRDVEAAVHAARHGAHFVGMILVPGSARYVASDAARKISDALRAFREQTDTAALLWPSLPAAAAPAPGDSLDVSVQRLAKSTAALMFAARRARPLIVGVFMDQPRRDVSAAAEAAGVDVIQLHGRELPADFLGFEFPVIKVLHVPAAGGPHVVSVTAEALVNDIVAWSGVACAVLLDSGSASSPSGGSGLLFDHSAALSAIECAMEAARGALGGMTAPPARLPVLLAGGLTPDNVAEVVAVLAQRRRVGACAGSSRPRVVPCLLDVSSGVEGPTKGLKDPARVAAFLSQIRSSS